MIYRYWTGSFWVLTAYDMRLRCTGQASTKPMQKEL